MIRVHVRLRGGRLFQVKAEGHAESGRKGSSIVCAAVTVLLRTAARTIGGRTGIASTAGAAGPGDLGFRVDRCEAESEPWLSGVTDFLLQGLRDVAAEYPDEVQLTLAVT